MMWRNKKALEMLEGGHLESEFVEQLKRFVAEESVDR